MRPGFSRTLVLALFVSCRVVAQDQNDSLRPPVVKLYDVHIGAGQFHLPLWSASQAAFRQHVPGSALMTGDLMEIKSGEFVNAPVFFESQGVFNSSRSQPALMVQGAFTWKIRDSEDGESERPWLRTGFSYRADHRIFAGGFFKSSRDTIQNDSYRRDSSSFRSLSYGVSGKNVFVEAAVVVRFNEPGIFSVYAGLGVMGGIGYQRSATVVSSTVTLVEESVETAYGTAYLSRQENSSSAREHFRTAVAPAFGFQAILGAELRLGHKYRPLDKMRLFGEVRPVLGSEFVKGTGAHTSLSAAITGGLIYRFE